MARFGITMAGKDGKPCRPLLNACKDGMRRGQFRSHLKDRGGVIPCQGFYEWREESGKQPYYFSCRDGHPMTLADI